MNKERTMLSVPEGSVKRYAVFSVPPVIEEYRDGYFVNYEDYEVLKKKVDALESCRDDLLAQLNFSTGGDLYEEVQRLKKDIERLTKAGDDMAFSLYVNPKVKSVGPEINNWNAAKNGGVLK